MGRALIHEAGKFFEWSTVVDAPVSEAMTREEAIEWCNWRHHMTAAEAEDRLARAEATGTSAVGGWLSKEDIDAYNRAGENEQHVPYAKIIEMLGITPPR